MKKYKRIITLCIISIFISISGINAQIMAPGDPPGGPETGDEPIGGNAPVSGGTIILITSAFVYGTKKVFSVKRKAQNCSE